MVGSVLSCKQEFDGLLRRRVRHTYSATATTVFASRVICQRPSRFSKTEKECPDMFVYGSFPCPSRQHRLQKHRVIGDALTSQLQIAFNC